MILTFNGSPEQEGYERLEVMCFNDENKTFEFRDIAFPGEAKNPQQLDDIPAHNRNESFVISPVNGYPGRDCRQCHMNPARPNWQPYNLWPGFCGADADEYYISKFHGSNDGNKGPHYLDKGSIEKKGCDQFFKGNFQQGRYAQLLPYEPLILAKLSRLFQPHGFDVSNWSLVTLGGHSFRDGLNGVYGTSLTLMLEKPFAKHFLSHEVRINDLIDQLHTSQLESYNSNESGMSMDNVVKARQEMCDIVKPKADLERKNSSQSFVPSSEASAATGSQN